MEKLDRQSLLREPFLLLVFKREPLGKHFTAETAKIA